jgi:hypothetical protein
MNDLPPDTRESKGLVPVIAYRNAEAEDAFRVYSALARLAVEDNELGRLPLMQELRQLAYDRFNSAFEVL